MERDIKIALAGGGGADDSRLLDEVFASWIGRQGNLLYLPVALRGIRSFESCFEWITEPFAPLHVTRITLWTDLVEHKASELDQFDGVYVGGGNTYSLLAELIHSGFDRHLRAYARAGGVIYGGSAGAVVLGRDIRTVSHIDRNHVGLLETNCLDLALGYAIWPHYQPQDDSLIQGFIQNFEQPVLAIPERSGVVIASETLRRVGFEPSYSFEARRKFEL
jgi:dipeptidase E